MAGIAIAKASLVASFMRPDPLSVGREALAAFHESIDTALKTRSKINIQHCKEWLVNSHVASSRRASAVGKYFVALASDLKDVDKKNGAPSGRTQQLLILYVLNDLLHYYKYHAKDSSEYRHLLEGLREHIPSCVRHAASYEAHTFPNQKRRIARLIDTWANSKYFDAELLEEIEGIAKSACSGAMHVSNTKDNVKKESPYIMPAIHGDTSVPYYELPAGNMMPLIVPNAPLPIPPRRMRALQFVPGPAEPALVETLKSFLKEVDLLYSSEMPEDEAISMEMDDLGQNVSRDVQSGDILHIESYYGWTKEFCENMKRKRVAQRRSRSPGSSRSRSHSPRKRIRFGDDRKAPGRGRGRSYSHSRSSSRSRSRSRSSPPRRSVRARPSPSRSRSRTRSRSRSPPRRFHGSSNPSAPGRVSKSSASEAQQYFPLSTQSAATPIVHQQINLLPQTTIQQQSLQSLPPPPPPPSNGAYNHSFYNPRQMPIPPPRPANWQGPWPPAPPPPPLPPSPHSMPLGQTFAMQNMPQGYAQAGWSNAIPPPPPPPPQHQHHNDGYNHGQGGYNQNYNSRGGYNQQGRGGGNGSGRW